MQQSSATQSLHPSFWGLRKIVAYSHSSSQCLLVSTVFGTLHPTSYDFYTCNIIITWVAIICVYFPQHTVHLVVVHLKDCQLESIT